jgi:dTDP-4-dehydrorhamnose reductase
VKKIAVLGSSGMIGSGITRRLSELGHEITEFNRQGVSTTGSNKAFKIEIEKSNYLQSLKMLNGFDYIINTLGVIRHKIETSDGDKIENAIVVNGIFPIQLDQFGKENRIRVIQIGTDCVYSGNKGSYIETDSFDPVDMYGHSKVIGETKLQATMNLRVSVIGKEVKTKVELLEWVLHQSLESEVNGYTNHIWSGVTPFQLGQLLDGIISNDLFKAGTQHLVPENKLSKFELIKLIAEYVPQSNLRIREVETSISVDRSLSTMNEPANKALWVNAGYDQVPSIQDMLREYMEWTGIDCSH